MDEENQQKATTDITNKLEDCPPSFPSNPPSPPPAPPPSSTSSTTASPTVARTQNIQPSQQDENTSVAKESKLEIEEDRRTNGGQLPQIKKCVQSYRLV